MTTSIDKSDLQRRMHGAVEALKHDLGGLRTGRASIALLDHITVEVWARKCRSIRWRRCRCPSRGC